MTTATPYYITTPIYYANDVPHIGHAYTTLACDVLARFYRLDGRDVMFLTGTDEHGQKVEKSAERAGKSPQAFCDEVSARFRDLLDVLGVSHDQFIRTTEPRHYAAVQAMWQRMVDAGDIYLDSYSGWYSVRDEAFYAESELQKSDDDGWVAPTGAPVEWVEEPSYFFRLSSFSDKLLEYYEAHPDFVRPKSRLNEVASFVRGGLRDLSISRTSFKWGVPVKNDPDHITYVWLDALTNYVTALGFPDTDGAPYQQFWPASVHMVGKDILRFHAVYWPAFLMSAGLPLPERVFAHGWWTNEGQKISKSLGNVIDPFALIEEFGLDPVRYFLMREVPFGNDGDFSRAAMVNRTNGDLANDLGNLAQRALSMVAKNCDGRVPVAAKPALEDEEILSSAEALLADVRKHMDQQQLHLALEHIWRLISATNGFFANAAPWALKKTDPDRMQTVLYVTIETVRRIALVLQPFMPTSMGNMLDLLAVPGDERAFRHAGTEFALKSGTQLPKPVGVFPRFVEAEPQKKEMAT
ncbi:MAG: methionine--tRNA ligase [Pseudomonadota bacterium]